MSPLMAKSGRRPSFLQTRTHFQIESAPRLNNWSLALADRCFAFAPAPGKADGENYRANCNQEFSHEVTPRSKNHKKVSLFFDLQLVRKGHTAYANFWRGTMIYLARADFFGRRFNISLIWRGVLPRTS